jgi:hypothetical protein
MNKTRMDMLIKSTGMDIFRLPDLKTRLYELQSSQSCNGCGSIKIGFLTKQIKEIENRLACQSSRILRLGKKHAQTLKAPNKS